MTKRKRTGLRPILYVIFFSILALQMIACGPSLKEPVSPTENEPIAVMSPSVTDAPDISGEETPMITETPTITESPQATETPRNTEVSKVTEVSKATEVPQVTDVPEATEKPIVTESPKTTEAPQVTETPKPTEAPKATDIPQITETPQPTATPVPTAHPVPTEVPKEEEVPALPTPVFSKGGGFYNVAFSLSLSSDAGTKIYYTTDGSDPRTSSTASLYSKAIYIYDNTSTPNVYSAITDITLSGYWPPQYNVDKGIIIRAVAKTPEGEYSEVVSNSYFVGKTASYYSDLKVISMVTDSDYLFDPDTGAYMIGSEYYKWKNSSDYVSYDPSDVQNPTNYNSDGKESEFPVTIQVFEKGDSVYTADVGARISGNWSRAAAQKSIRFYAGKEYGTKKMKYDFFDGLTDVNGDIIKKFDKVTLRNGGNDHLALHFRDALIQDLAAGLALDYMASEPYILFINGEFWGFYLLREKPEDYYIQSHYGIDEKEVAAIKNGGLDSGTEEDLGDYRNFCNWAATADMTQDKNYEEFCARMDLQSFMDYIAVETYVNNNDWANSYMNNWMVWRSKTINPDIPKADGKWRFILYDLDMSTGIYGSTETSYHYDSLNKIYSNSSDYNLPAILRNLSKNKEFLQAFRANYERIINTCFAPNKVNAKLDAYAKAYGDATKATFFRFGMDWAANNYEGELSNIRTFFERRPEYAKHYLDDFCGKKSESSSGGTTVSQENLAPNTAKWTYYGNAVFSTDPSNNAFHVTVPQTTQNSWDIQSQAPGLKLEKGCEYRISFDASFIGSGKFDININRFDGSGYPNCFWAGATLSQEMKNYEFFFTMDNDTYTDWNLCFNFGSGQGDFVIKNVTLNKMK